MFDNIVKAAQRTPLLKAFVGPSVTGDVGWVPISGTSAQIRPETYIDYAELYQKISFIYACIYAIASAGSDVPPGVKRVTGDGQWEDAWDHPFGRLISGAVNERQSFAELIEGTLTYLELAGDAYWEPVYSETTGLITRFYLLRPDRVTIVPTADKTHIKKYVYKYDSNATPRNFDPHELLHFQYFHPFNDWYGFGSAYAATNVALLELYALDYSKKYLKNFGVPDGYLTTDLPISAEEATRIRLTWGQRKKALMTPVLPKALKWVSIQNTPQELRFDQIRKMNREEILAIFKVPPAMVELVEATKYNTYYIQEEHFYKRTVGPKLKKIAATLNSFLLNDYPAGTDKPVVLDFDVNSVILGNRAQAVDSAIKEVMYGISTPNQIIERLGLGESYEDGDKHYMKQGVNPIGEQKLLSPPPEIDDED